MNDDQPTNFEDRILTCVECRGEFLFSAGEQAYFRMKGLQNDPRRCKPCKAAQKARVGNVTPPRREQPREPIQYPVNCAACNTPTVVPFFPSQGRPVYCRACFGANAPAAGRA